MRNSIYIGVKIKNVKECSGVFSGNVRRNNKILISDTFHAEDY
ncbi:hypothetical protein [Emticicia sp. BO119]|nr:hypothetical protein [Emticicia sp. BO119]